MLADAATSETADLQSAAADPQTPPASLAELATGADLDLRRAIASNPNTPGEVLCTLGADFPEEFLANPALLLLLLAEPNLADRMPLATLRVLSRYETLPAAILAGAARRGDFQIEQALAANPQTPAPILSDLAEHPSDRVRDAARLHVALAGELAPDADWRDRARLSAIAILKRGRTEPLLRPWVPPLLVEWLATSEAPILRETAAKNPVTPGPLLACLAADPVLQVRRAVACNPTTPATALAALSREGRPELLAALAANPQAPAELFAALAGEAVAGVRQKICAQTQPTGDALHRLVRSEWAILAAIAQNPRSPRSQLTKLLATLEALAEAVAAKRLASRAFSQQYSLLRWQIALHPNVPQSLAERAFGRGLCAQVRSFFERAEPLRPGIASFGILKQIAENPRAPRYVLSELAATSLPLQAIVARNPNAPPELIRAWSELPARRRSVAPNPQISARLLGELIGDRDRKVRRDAACNPALDPISCARLAGDRDEGVRCNLAQNPATPVAVLEQLLADGSPGVSAAATAPYLEKMPAGLPRVLAGTLRARWDPRDLDCQFVVLLHPQMPPECLVARSRSLNWLERCAIAQNPSTPQACLERLAREGNCMVRAAARENLAGKQHSLDASLDHPKEPDEQQCHRAN